LVHDRLIFSKVIHGFFATPIVDTDFRSTHNAALAQLQINKKLSNSQPFQGDCHDPLHSHSFIACGLTGSAENGS
jgi:hypothetical protein